MWPETGQQTTPADLGDLGDYSARTGHVLRLLLDLLDIAKPDGWQWRTVAVEGVHSTPAGLEVQAGGTVVLRVTAGGALVEEEKQSRPEQWADWVIPAETVRAAVQ